MTLTIIAAAIKVDGVIVTEPPPARHHDLIHAYGMGGRCYVPPDRQGFLTSERRFVRREPAAVIAYEAGQIPEPKHRLFSEDLW